MARGAASSLWPCYFSRTDPAAARLDAALENARRFFVGEADVQKALRKLARLLDEDGIPYAIAGWPVSQARRP